METPNKKEPKSLNLNYGYGAPRHHAQPLTQEQISKLRAESEASGEKIQYQPRAACTHKEKNGQSTLIQNWDGTYTCTICHETFKVYDRSPEEIEDAINTIINILQTNKLVLYWDDHHPSLPGEVIDIKDCYYYRDHLEEFLEIPEVIEEYKNLCKLSRDMRLAKKAKYKDSNNCDLDDNDFDDEDLDRGIILFAMRHPIIFGSDRGILDVSNHPSLRVFYKDKDEQPNDDDSEA